jgi:peptidyl-prolyl cis-trans isomerase SurA
MMKRIAAALAMTLALGATPAPAMAQASEGVAAIVNDTIISTWDVRQRAAFLLLSAQIEPTPEGIGRMAPQALRSLIDETLQVQEAKERFKIEISDEEVNEQLAQIARSNNLSVDAYQRNLAALGVNVSTLKRQLKAETTWRRLVGGFYGSRIRISQDQINDALAQIQTNAGQTQYLVSEVFLPAANAAEIPAVEAGALELLSQMQQGAPFYLVARQFSASPSAAQGGDLGWLPAAELRPELRAATEALQQGQVSMPIVTSAGVYIVALRGKRDGVAPTTRFTLKQVVASGADAEARLTAARGTLSSCTGAETAAARISGADVIDLGEIDETDLSPDVRARLQGVQPGQSTPAFGTDGGASLLLVCTRQTTTRGAQMPSRQDVEDELFQAQLGMLSQRYLNNLRREATILTREVGTAAQ